MDSLSPLIGIKNSYRQILPAARAASSAKVRDEFLTIFYKELLKQVFKAPDLGLADEEKESGYLSTFNSEQMVEQLAGMLAAKSSWLAPAAEGE